MFGTDLRKAISMATNDSHIARFRILIVDWRVLFDGEFEIIIVPTCSRPRILANIRGSDGMFLDLEP
jgi:hypothetical protein